MKRFTSIEKVEIIKNGFDKLKSTKGYSQNLVVAKLNQIDCEASAPVMSRIRNSNMDDLTNKKIDEIFSGFTNLMKKEMCLRIDQVGDWKEIKSATPEEIIIEEKDPQKKGLQVYAEGRLDIAQKVEFFSSAESEMIEFGISLNSFTNYLNNRNPKKFKDPIIKLLKKKVKIKCYLLDPEWNGSKIYFDDRESVLKEGLSGIEKIRASLRRLKIFYSEIHAFEYSKYFEVYTYRHFPNNYFLAIDKDEKSKAKLMLSNYLFGERRAYCPVLEFKRVDQPILFVRYNDSLLNIIKGAKKVNFDSIPD